MLNSCLDSGTPGHKPHIDYLNFARSRTWLLPLCLYSQHLLASCTISLIISLLLFCFLWGQQNHPVVTIFIGIPGHGTKIDFFECEGCAVWGCYPCFHWLVDLPYCKGKCCTGNALWKEAFLYIRKTHVHLCIFTRHSLSSGNSRRNFQIHRNFVL